MRQTHSRISESDLPTPTDSFERPDPLFGRVCQAVRLFTSAERAAVYLANPRLRPVAAAGLPFERLVRAQAGARMTPVLMSALAGSEVVMIDRDELPGSSVAQLGATTVACAPLLVAGRRFGALIADRRGEPFELDDLGRERLSVLAKIAALLASARDSEQSSRETAGVSSRLRMARDIHERVIPLLFGLSMTLSMADQATPEQMHDYANRLREVIAELRSALVSPEQVDSASGRSLGDALDRLRREHPDLHINVTGEGGPRVPSTAEPLLEHFLTEAVANAAKHARPSQLEVSFQPNDSTLCVEVRNDRALPNGSPRGVGLRLIAEHALRHGAVVEYGAPEPGHWRTRLVVPVE
jgi:signal transduction histidine kinase